MDIGIFHSQTVDKIGQVFTPLEWAKWLLNRWNVFDSWLNGAVICDPTAGEGVFALALFDMARSARISITPDMLARLTLIEVDPELIHRFRNCAFKEYGISFPSSNILIRDVITTKHSFRYDILVGNPPWTNFTDLPDAYKERLKPYFIREGLVPDIKRVLLGSSRTDLAALVLKIALGQLLNPKGKAYFFLPLSLFFGDDAHTGFRDYLANQRDFCVEEVHEFSFTKIFKSIGTSYCCATFQIDKEQKFPVRYFQEKGANWNECFAKPFMERNDQWRIITKDSEVEAGRIRVDLSPTQKPRQGVNTCGANEIFIFENKPPDLPAEYLFPLATKHIWKNREASPIRWILLPYNKITGKALFWSEIEQYDALKDYLLSFKPRLTARKGTLIRSMIDKGFWWALLGVGPYSFAPYKIVWEAYGKKEFLPTILHQFCGQPWQPNQAMHAFIPAWNEGDATRIHNALLDPRITTLLQDLQGGGKCNWAQPGKIAKILLS